VVIPAVTLSKMAGTGPRIAAASNTNSHSKPAGDPDIHVLDTVSVRIAQHGCVVPTGKWRGKDEDGAGNRHSDNKKFRSDLNRPENCKMSERLLKTLRKSGDFQAEYKGAIPFIRSSVFSTLTRAPDCIPTNPAASFLLEVAAYLLPVW
jgi:hypothetical protein